MALGVQDFSGRERVEPSIDTKFTFTEGGQAILANPFVPTLLARFNAGPIGEVVEHTSLAEFLESRDPEDLRDAASLCGRFALNPGFNVADMRRPSKLRTVRVGAEDNAPTPATWAIKGAGDVTVATATSLDLGTGPNNLYGKITAGTTAGRRVYLKYKDNPAWILSGDNLGPLFTVDYNGDADTATLVVTRAADKATTFAITLVGASDGSASINIDLTSPDFDTVEKVASFINRQVGYTATLATTDLNLSSCPSYEFDAVAGTELVAAGATVVTANLGAIIVWLNQNARRIGPVPGVTVARAAAAVLQPAVMAAYTRFAGGTQPAVASSDWTAALDELEAAELTSGVLFVDTYDSTVQELVRTWMQEQLDEGKVWRAVFGMQAYTPAESARKYAGQIANERIAIWHQRVLDTRNTQRDPFHVAAMFAGATGGVDAPGDVQSVVLTNRRINASAIDPADRQKKSVREKSLLAGVNTLREEGGKVLISLGRSTYQGNTTALQKWSETVTLDWLRIAVEERVRPQMVAWGTVEYVANVRGIVMDELRKWRDAGVIAAGLDPDTGAAVPAFTIPVVEVRGGAVYISFEVGLVGEVDHVRIRGNIRRVALSTSLAA